MILYNSSQNDLIVLHLQNTRMYYNVKCYV
jgi:hypothetical protein